MRFELQTEPAPAGLTPLGQVVELRELPYGELRETLGAGESGTGLERVLGASLHVDGVPLGYEGLRALPGRFSGAVAIALERVGRMHGLLGAPEAEPPKA
jgi:hypothetical protein